MRHSHYPAAASQRVAGECKTVSSSLEDTTSSTTVRSSSCALSESSPSPLLWDGVGAEEDDGCAPQRLASGSTVLDVSRPPTPRAAVLDSRGKHRTRTIYLIRHAESESNALGNSFALVDPGLTAAGVAQAQQIAELLSERPPTLVLSSSLTRALATANFAFPCRKTTPPIVALEGIREIVGRRCVSELRRPRGKLRDAFPTASFDFIAHDRDPMAELAVDFDHRCAGPGERKMSLEARAARMWSVLAAMPHCPATERIAVVSHYYFLTYLCDVMLRNASAASSYCNFSFAAPNSVDPQCRLDSLRGTDALAALKTKLDRWCNGGVVEVTLEFPSPAPTETDEALPPVSSCADDLRGAAHGCHDWSAIRKWLAPLMTDAHGALTSEPQSANHDVPSLSLVSSHLTSFEATDCGPKSTQETISTRNANSPASRSGAVEQAQVRVRDWNVRF